jgi:hypothetical protein
MGLSTLIWISDWLEFGICPLAAAVKSIKLECTIFQLFAKDYGNIHNALSPNHRSQRVETEISVGGRHSRHATKGPSPPWQALSRCSCWR